MNLFQLIVYSSHVIKLFINPYIYYLPLSKTSDLASPPAETELRAPSPALVHAPRPAKPQEQKPAKDSGRQQSRTRESHQACHWSDVG